MVKSHSRIAAAAVSLFLYWVIWKSIPGIVEKIPFLERFVWQYRFLLGFAAFLAIFGGFFGVEISRFTLLLRLMVVYLYCYAVPGDPYIPVLFVLAVIQETGFRQSTVWGGIIIALTLSAALIAVIPDRSVFGVPVSGWNPGEFIVFAALVLPAIVLAQMLRRALDGETRWRGTVDRLDLAVSRLAEVNLGYQHYAQEVRGDSIAEERRRISREIHDTVGYSLTNIRVMLEAATLRMNNNPDETVELIRQSVEEADLCLEQTRMAMRQLRTREISAASGISAIQRLVKAFGDVTGIRVCADYGNVPSNWPIIVEKTVYRLVQEGMTNAFRHGMATEIMIYLRHDKDVLRLIIRDNGRGGGEVMEGLGITGMRERVGALNGEVEFGPCPDGFEVRAWLPLPKEE